MRSRSNRLIFMKTVKLSFDVSVICLRLHESKIVKHRLILYCIDELYTGRKIDAAAMLCSFGRNHVCSLCIIVIYSHRPTAYNSP